MTAITIPINTALVIWATCCGFVLLEAGVCVGLWLALYDSKDINRLLLWHLAEVKKTKFGKDKEAEA